MADHATATQRRAEDREQLLKLNGLTRRLQEDPAMVKDDELRELELHWDPRIAALAIDERVTRAAGGLVATARKGSH